MIENYLWQYLVLFAQNERITLVAQKVGVTPASVSRGLKKLEAKVGLRLFEHGPQKLELTPVGRYLATKATELLTKQEQMLVEVKNYAKQQTQLRFGSTIKGVKLLAQELFGDQVMFSSNYLASSEVKEKLLSRENSLIFTTEPLKTEKITTTFLGEEQLAIKVTALNELYERETVTFAELAGHKFVVAKNLGLWGKILEEQTHDALFLPQSTLALAELTKHSNFPLFKTNISAYLDKLSDDKRKLIPITDKAAHVPLYAAYLKENETLLRDKIEYMCQILAQIK